MRIRINPTRMQLLLLAKRLKLARRGHKLLKDKLDGLVQRFYKLKSEYQDLYHDLEPRLAKVFKKAVFGTALAPQSVLDEIGKSTVSATLSATIHNIMGVKIREYSVDVLGKAPRLSKIITPSELHDSHTEFSHLLPKLISLAAKSLSLRLMSEQIIETRRRVNALEYVLIPELVRAATSIKMKLSELERAGQVTLLKIKDIVRSH